MDDVLHAAGNCNHLETATRREVPSAWDCKQLGTVTCTQGGSARQICEAQAELQGRCSATHLLTLHESHVCKNKFSQGRYAPPKTQKDMLLRLREASDRS